MPRSRFSSRPIWSKDSKDSSCNAKGGIHSCQRLLHDAAADAALECCEKASMLLAVDGRCRNAAVAAMKGQTHPLSEELASLGLTHAARQYTTADSRMAYHSWGGIKGV